MKNSFKPHLWHALWNAELVSVPEVSVKCGRAILERGASERHFLSEQIGEDAWQRLLAAWNRPDGGQMAALQLGTGAVLTEFFTAPVALSGEDRAAAAHLGTLANLLVGIYDDFMDEGVSAGDTDLESGPLAALVSAYYRQAAALPGAAARPEIAGTLRRAIVKMHSAEQATLGAESTEGRMRGWQRKSTLPFVVMGLPAWLMTPEIDASRYFRHLRWLCRCGEFWGWIDDAMDWPQDANIGHPNKVGDALHTRGLPPERVAAQIAEMGRAVLVEWRNLTPHAALLPLPVQEALPTCLFSAFGGLPLSHLQPSSTIA